MVEIIYMSRKGDSPTKTDLNHALEIVEKEQAAGRMVVNLDDNTMVPLLEDKGRPKTEKELVENATMGKITENSRLGIINPVRGG